MSNVAAQKLQDLKKKANFWFSITKSLPSVCEVECWKVCFEKSFAAHEKLWSFQQENRKLLEKDCTFKREQIGDIAWNIASTYLHYYIRSISKDFLQRSILFFEAIIDRGYFDQIKQTKKYREFLLCFSIVCAIGNKFKRSRAIINQITESDHPFDNSQSFILSQPSLLLNDIENLLQISNNGDIFERGPIDSFFAADTVGNNHKVSSFVSISNSSKILYGELTIPNVVLSGLLSHFKAGISQFFIKASNSINALSCIFHAIKTSCITSTDILLLHIDTQIRKTLVGEDVFYFEDSETNNNEDDQILSLQDLSLVKRKLIVISENYLILPDLLSETIFVIVPLKSAFWTTILLYSVEFLFYDLYSKSNSKGHRIGKIENVIRIHSQLYHKKLTDIIAPFFDAENTRYKWIMDCQMGRMLLFNYLMAYFFLSWLEFKSKNLHLNCPIQKLLPREIFTAHNLVYDFLETLTG